MSGKQIRLQVPLKLFRESTAGSHRWSGSESRLLVWRQKIHTSQKCYGELANWQLMTSGRSQMLATRNFGDTQYSAMYHGAWCRRQWWTVTVSLYCTRWGITSQCRSSCISRDRPHSYFRVPVTRCVAAFWTPFEHCVSQFRNNAWHSSHNHCSQNKTHAINIHTVLNFGWTTFTANFLIQNLSKYQSRLSAFCNANLWCDLPDVINCQFTLGNVHILSPDQQPGIHRLYICGIQPLLSEEFWWDLKMYLFAQIYPYSHTNHLAGNQGQQCYSLLHCHENILIMIDRITNRTVLLRSKDG